MSAFRIKSENNIHFVQRRRHLSWHNVLSFKSLEDAEEFEEKLRAEKERKIANSNYKFR